MALFPQNYPEADTYLTYIMHAVTSVGKSERSAVASNETIAIADLNCNRAQVTASPSPRLPAHLVDDGGWCCSMNSLSIGMGSYYNKYTTVYQSWSRSTIDFKFQIPH
jgi:hypothetical protein